MALFKKRPQSAQQKAQRAQIRVAVRLACCIYIVFYVIIPLIREPYEGGGMSPTMRIIVITAFSVITAAIMVATVIEVVRNWKAGLYKASSYTDDEGDSGFGIRNAESGDDEGEVEENSEFGIRNAELENDDEEENSEFGVRNAELSDDEEEA